MFISILVAATETRLTQLSPIKPDFCKDRIVWDSYYSIFFSPKRPRQRVSDDGLVGVQNMKTVSQVKIW